MIKQSRKQELKEEYNNEYYIWLFAIIFIHWSYDLITMRPYVKRVVNEVKFTYVAEEYKTIKVKVEKEWLKKLKN